MSGCNPVVIWCFADAKSGHLSQTNGFIAAISRQCECTVHHIHIADHSFNLFALVNAWLHKRTPEFFPADKPDLIIGAGHATHAQMLLARHLCGGKVLVFMKPSLPAGWFDALVVPAHDKASIDQQRLIETEGVLNNIPYVANKSPDCGLMLIGGKSSHFEWNTAAVLAQIEMVLARSANTQWTLTTSRRTPDGFLDELALVAPCDRLTVVPYEDCGAGWLLQQFEQAGQVWVTADSVSMIYESLTSGAAVGVFTLEKGHGRIQAGLQRLIDAGTVMPFSVWQTQGRLVVPDICLNEAERVSSIILERWFGS